MFSKEEIKAMIAEDDNKIEKFKNEIEIIEDHKASLENMLIEINKSEATQRLLNSINEVNENNSIHVQLNADTKTTPIMDCFNFSDKKFLVFDDAFFLKKCLRRVSLVIAKDFHGVNYRYNGLTMTDLKKIVKSFILDDILKYLNKDSREYPLYQELIVVSKKLKEDKTKKIMAFQKPCMIGGQTFSNQSGYGSEYYGEDQIYQGTLYGETTKFMIIGGI